MADALAKLGVDRSILFSTFSLQFPFVFLWYNALYHCSPISFDSLCLLFQSLLKKIFRLLIKNSNFLHNVLDYCVQIIKENSSTLHTTHKDSTHSEFLNQFLSLRFVGVLSKFLQNVLDYCMQIVKENSSTLHTIHTQRLYLLAISQQVFESQLCWSLLTQNSFSQPQGDGIRSDDDDNYKNLSKIQKCLCKACAQFAFTFLRY